MRKNIAVAAIWTSTIALACVIGIIGGSEGQAHKSAPTAPQTGEPFLPAYLDMIQGKRPFPQNTSCEPHDLESLLIPCDKP